MIGGRGIWRRARSYWLNTRAATRLERFAALYKRELLGNPAGLRALESSRSESAAGDAALLCYEPDGAPCHRRPLREMARDPGLLRADFAHIP